MRKWFCIYTRQSAAICIIAMVVCVLAVAVKFPRGNSFDYLGLIIGIFALMITFVVAWQIWQTIASREEIKDARAAAEKSEELVKRIEGIEAQLKILPDTHSAYISVADGLSFLLNNRHFKAFHLFATGIIDSLKDINDKGRCAMRALANLNYCMDFDENDASMNEYKEKWEGVVGRLSEIEDALRNADQENKIFQSLARQQIDAFKQSAREKGFKI